MSQQHNAEQHATPASFPPYPMYPYQSESEINLGELWLILVRKKRIIISSTAAGLLLAGGYLATTDSLYQTYALTLPPQPADISALNIAEELQKFTPEQVYAQFLTNVTSVHVQRKAFYDIATADPELSALSEDDKLQRFRSFAAKLNAMLPKKEKEATVEFVAATKLALDHTDPELTRRFIDKTLEFANELTLSNNKKLLAQLIANRLDKIPQEIERLTLSEKIKREAKITSLEEETRIEKEVLTQQITALKQKIESEKQARIANLEEKDKIARNAILEKMEALRAQAKLQREAQINQLENEDQIQRESLQHAIQVLRNNAKNKRQDRISQLTEAANIAAKLGIEEPIATYNKNAPNNPLMAYVEISTTNNERPLYLNGERALRAEIKELESRQTDDAFITELRPLLDKLANLENNPTIAMLKKRTSDDPFISELPTLQKELAMLKTNEEIEALKSRTTNDLFSAELLNLNRQLALLNEPARIMVLKARQDDSPFAEGIRALGDEQRKLSAIKTNLAKNEASSAATIDRKAYTLPSPVSPKTTLVLALAFVASAFLGVLAAFFAHFIDTQKRNDAKE